MIPDYFTKKCSACDIARRKYLPTIKMGCKIKKYNVERFRHTSKVKRWRDWASGYIPSMQLNGNGKVERYIGLSGLKELSGKVEKDEIHSRPIRISKEKKELDLDSEKEIEIGGDLDGNKRIGQEKHQNR